MKKLSNSLLIGTSLIFINTELYSYEKNKNEIADNKASKCLQYNKRPENIQKIIDHTFKSIISDYS